MPLVSVVMPVYRTEKFVAAAVRSVLAQSFEDFELIVVNDGTDDNSMAIVAGFQDDRIRVVEQPNAGLSAARNTGILASRGEFVALLDSDDVWDPRKLEVHVHHLTRRPQVGVSYSGSRFINESGQPTGLVQAPQLEGVTPEVLFSRNPIGNGSAPVIRRMALFDAAIEVDGALQFFRESLRQSEDVECWLRIALSSRWQFEGVQGLLTLYRLHGFSLSANIRRQYQAWLEGVEFNAQLNPDFVNRNFSRAAAFQCRYLARRAVGSDDQKTAFEFLLKAFKHNTRAMIGDVARTTATLLAAVAIGFVSYSSLERAADAIRLR